MTTTTCRALALVCLGALAATAVLAREAPRVVPLLATSQSVVGEPIVYPVGAPAKVTAAIVVLAPGEETGWHTHGSPVYGYMLEGEITVDYGAAGSRTYRAGDSLMEAMAVAHNGRNTGAEVARILAVFMGAEGVATTLPATGPE